MVWGWAIFLGPVPGDKGQGRQEGQGGSDFRDAAMKARDERDKNGGGPDDPAGAPYAVTYGSATCGVSGNALFSAGSAHKTSGGQAGGTFTSMLYNLGKYPDLVHFRS